MDIRTKAIITWIMTIVAVTGGLWLAFALRGILMLVFISFIFASALYPAVQWAKAKLRIPREVTILFLYAVIFAVVSFLVSLLIPPLFVQSSQLLNIASQRLGIEQFDVNSFGQVNFGEIAQSFDRYSSLMSQFTGSIQTVFSLISSTFTIMLVFFTFLVMSFHMLLSLERIAASFAWLLPDKTAEKRVQHAHHILHGLIAQMGAWVRGQLSLMIIIGVATYAGLLLLGVPYALPLALFAGLLEIVPNLGPTISAIPGILAATFLVSPVTGGITLVFYILVQQVENNFLVPMIMREAVDVWPLTTIVLMLAGFELFGVLGAVIAIPLYITVRYILQDLYPEAGPFSHRLKEEAKEQS